MPVQQPAILALADGTIFRGRSIGADGLSAGEVVFNTAMTGYQEILTDPSYARQIVTLTYPHIGNTGTNPEDAEALKLHVAGLVVRDLPLRASNWRMTATLDAYLRDAGIVAISDIDTRKLTRILREGGAQSGCLMAGPIDEQAALTQARAFPGLAGMDLAKVVSTSTAYEWGEGTWTLNKGYAKSVAQQYHVVAFDFGVKHNILRMLAQRACRVSPIFPVAPGNASPRGACAASSTSGVST